MSHNNPQDFYVVLTNVSSEPQVVWELWNSWGYQTISFELTTADGNRFVLSRGPEGFTKNNPSTFAVQPGEHQVYAIHFDKWWVSTPVFPKADEMPITLKAAYQVSPTREATEHKVKRHPRTASGVDTRSHGSVSVAESLFAVNARERVVGISPAKAIDGVNIISPLESAPYGVWESGAGDEG